MFTTEFSRMDYCPPGICSLGGGSSPAPGSSTQNVIQSSEPPAFALPYLQDVFNLAQKSFDISPVTPFQGEVRAPIIPEQVEALNLARGLGRSSIGIGTPVENLGLDTIAGRYLRPESNPYLEATTQAAIRPLVESFRETIVPTIRSSAIEQGAFGGSRQGLTENLAARDLARQIADTTAKINFANYTQERQNQLTQGPAALEAGFNLQRQPIGMLAQVGDILRGFAQEPIDEALWRYNQAREAPFGPLLNYSSIVQGLTPALGTRSNTTTQSNIQGPSQFSQFLQGALGGAAGGAGLGSLLGAGTAGAGALGGGAALGGLGLGGTSAGLAAAAAAPPLWPFLLGGALLGGAGGLF
jgi:hypothetical protein